MSDVTDPSTSGTPDIEDVFVPPRPAIRRLEMEHPWGWLAAGWRDLRAAPGASLPYGLVFAVLGWILLLAVARWQAFYVILPVAGGFMLIGPVAAVGLYEISRRLGEGHTPRLGETLGAWRPNASQIAFMGVILLVIHIAWMRLAFLIFMLFFSGQPPRPETTALIDVFFSPSSVPFLAVGTAVGAVLAVIVFSITAVSIPMLLDRPSTNVITAMATSVEVVRQNPGPMLLWAWLIVLFIGAGMALGFVGLIVTLPLIGHATWAAYRATVTWPEDDAKGDRAAAG